MFIGRQFELNTLERLYTSHKFEFIVIYGRRRIGKTTLINHFIKNKQAIFFMGIESNTSQNLIDLSKAILEYNYIESNTTFLSFKDALDYVFQLSMKERIIMVIDEYPYVARTDKSFSSTLQSLIDKYHDQSQLMLIISGSSMSYMEDHVLAYKAPLYGRRTAQMKLDPFSFKESCAFMSHFNHEEKVLLYGALGGTPLYLKQINNNLSLKDNIINIYLNTTSMLYEEPLNLLKQEVREPALYNAIISAIANGATKMSEISNITNESTNICSAYIKNLINLGIIKKENPYGDTSSKKVIYTIEDNMFRFWYRFISNNTSLIERGASELVYNRIEPYFNEYLGYTFEDICKQYLWDILLQNQCPVQFSSIGRWWGNDRFIKKQTEIDIIAKQDKNIVLFGECKWRSEKTDISILEKLIHNSKLFSYTDVYYYLFSKSGYTKECLSQASDHVFLISFHDMIEYWNREGH